MKTQITKPVAEKTRYSEEYKQQAVERWRNSADPWGQAVRCCNIDWVPGRQRAP